MSNNRPNTPITLGLIIFSILGLISIAAFIIDPYGEWSFVVLLAVLVTGWFQTRRKKPPV
ncbi:hypothetical protein [Desulforamulus ruminis]|uniref:Uncharacterized protein n=1 Tax=Desulforamulus ruminis (strain ATCC 23193 / DSM 2154 / NCIMB 8452 / DL) TaxID=696281 RepID=F6DQI0_DESRL|nr:hypothetical protein [Desulforamulus ruminis]AEG60874.1 hypothetical protein Desru_2648 [Desulforamulus ruminis DSM 2154]